MPLILPMLLKMVGSTLISMAMSLITKNFIKKLIIAALEKIVAATESDVDNKLLEEAKKAWSKADEEVK